MASVEIGGRVTISADGASDWLSLANHKQTVCVTCSEWGASAVRLEYSFDRETAVPIDDCQSIRSNRSINIETVGYIRMVGTAVRNAIELVCLTDANLKPQAKTITTSILAEGSVGEWVALSNDKQNVCVTCTDWTGVVARLEYSFDTQCVFPVDLGQGELLIQTNRVVVIETRGFVRVAASKVEKPIRLHVISLNDVPAIEPQVQNSPLGLGVDTTKWSSKWNDLQLKAVALAYEWLKVPSTRGGPRNDQPRALQWLIENGPSTHADWGLGAVMDWSDDPRDAARKLAGRINSRAKKHGEKWEILPENNQLVTIEMIRPKSVPKASR